MRYKKAQSDRKFPLKKKFCIEKKKDTMKLLNILTWTCVICVRLVTCLQYAILHFRGASDNSENKQLRRRNLNNSPSIGNCKLYWKYEDTEAGDIKSLECEVQHDGKVRRLGIEGLSKAWMAQYEAQIVSGETTLISPTFDVIKSGNTIQVGDNAHTYIESGNHGIVEEEHHEQNKDNQRLLAQSWKGTKRAVVLHIETRDSATPFSVERLNELFFGMSNETTSLRSQLDACSYNQLDIAPSTGEDIVGGVYKIKLDEKTQSDDENGAQILNAALDQLRTKFGHDLRTVFDHIMVCVPKGVKPFRAYAWMNDYLSVYYDTWCQSLSAKMHELGHNVGFSHSGRGTCDNGCEHGDFSGYMGHVYNRDDFPKMCYNAPKSWQLGWYNSKSAAVNPLQYAWNGELVGISDYARIQGQSKAKVILKLSDPNHRMKYYISFNRKADFNSGTQLGKNKILVTSEGESGFSIQEAKLGSKNNEFIIKNFANSKKNVLIRLNYIDKSSQAWTANVTVTSPGIEISKGPPTHPPTRPPTQPPTKSPVASPESSYTTSLTHPKKISSGDNFVLDIDDAITVKAIQSQPSCGSFHNATRCKEQRRCAWNEHKKSCDGKRQGRRNSKRSKMMNFQDKSSD